jgi:ABC-type dipeptide/oligopeptide/nickel transport system permease component
MPRLWRFARRLLWSCATLLGVVCITFTISNVIPADPASLIAGESASPQQVAAVRARLGLDRPLPEQLVAYVGRLLHGDLGSSIFTSRPIIEDLKSRLPATIELALSALFLSIVIGIPVGVVAALRRGSLLDHVVRIVTVSGFAVASFWLAIMLQLLLVMELDLLPLSGRIEVTPPPRVTGLLIVDSIMAGNGTALWDSILHLVLPALTLALPVGATIVRFTRAGVLDAMSRSFVPYAQAMGLPPALIVWKYILRSALTSVVTQIGLVAGALLGGSVVTEAIFDWPGLGGFTVNSIVMSDYSAVMGATLWIATMYVVINILVDVLQTAIDPRQGSR